MVTALLLFLAQDAEPKVGLQAATAPEGVVLRWVVLGKPVPSDGFHLYRRRAGGEFERATTAPVKRLAAAGIERAYGKAFAEIMQGHFADAPQDKRPMQELALAILCDIDLRAAKAAGFYYLDTGATKGGPYDYELRAVMGGREETWAKSAQVTAGGEAKVAAPKEFKAAISGTAVELTWAKVSGVQAYVVYRASADAGKLERLTEPALFFAKDAQQKTPGRHSDETAPMGKTVWYAVAALDMFGRESEPSERVKIDVRDAVAPPPPKGFAAELKEGAARLRWDAVDAPDLAGYHVYRASGREPERLTREPVKETRFEDRSLASGAAVYFARAMDTSGNESAPSAGALVKVEDRTPPAKVSGVRASAVKGRVALEWTGVDDKDVSHYAVFRSTSRDGPWMRVGDAEETRFEEKLTESIGGALFYRVRAVDRSGNEGEASDSAQASLPDTVPPASPMLVRAVAVERGMRLEWELVHEGDVAGVRIEHAEAKDGPWAEASDLLKEKSLVVSKAGWYRIVAEDAAKNRSEPSIALEVSLKDRTPPVKPTGLSGRSTQDGVRLSWKGSSEPDVEGYIVERLDEGRWRQVGETVDKPEAVDWTAEGGRFRVVAFDRSGNRSEPSDEVEVKK